MPIIAHQSDADQRQEDDDARLDAIYAPLVARDIASREGGMFRTPRQAAVAASTLGDVQGNAALANRNGWPADVVASDPARFAAEDRRRRLDAVSDPDTARYLSDPRRNALVGDDIEATNTLGASIKRLLNATGGLLLNQVTGGNGIEVAQMLDSARNEFSGRPVQRSAGHDLWLSVKQAARRTTAAVSEAPWTVGDAVLNYRDPGRVFMEWQPAPAYRALRDGGSIMDALRAGDAHFRPVGLPRPDALRGTQDELYRTNANEYEAEASDAKIASDRGRSDTFLGLLSDYVNHPQLVAEDALGSITAMALGGAGLGPMTIPVLASTQASDAQLQIKQTLRQRNPSMSEAELDSRAAASAPLLLSAGLVFPRLGGGSGMIERFASGRAGQQAAERVASHTITDFSTRATIRRAAANIGTEALSEMGEEGTIQIGQNMGTGDPLGSGVGGAMAAGGVLAVGMAGPITAYEEHAMRAEDARRRAVIDHASNLVNSRVDANNLIALTRAAAAAKLGEVDPDEAAAFAREHMAGTDGNVYVPVSEVTALYQDEAEQRAAFEALTDDPQAVLDAQVTGEIAVPLDRWVSRVARLPRAEELAGVAKLAPGALSNKDLQAITPEQIQEDLARYYAEAAEDSERRSGPEGEVYDSVYGDLLPHYGPEGAGRVAATLQSFYRTMGARVGVDAKTLFDRFQINIGGKSRGNAGVAPRDVDTTIDPLIDAAIKGKSFSDDEVHGNAGGIISAILAAGGIRPDSVGADDLRSLQSLPPGFFNLAGRTAEAMAESLADDGWRGSFTDVDSYGRPGANELYDLVRREVFGDKVRADPTESEQDRIAKREAINNDIATVRDAFKRYEAETGVDPATLSREQQREIALGGLNALDQPAYHGTPHTVDRFSLQKIGTGEGAQAYGWGIYFASLREVAEAYRDNVKDMGRVRSINARMQELARTMSADEVPGSYRKYRTDAGREAAAEYDRLMDERTGVSNAKGNLYRVEVPEDSDLLDWDKPLSEQPEKVREAVAAAHIPRQSEYGGEYNAASWPGGMTGGQWYGKLASALSGGRADYNAARRGAGGGQRSASEYLQSIGIPGLRYLDGNSRNNGEGSHNYVIWDENAIGDPEALFQSSDDGFSEEGRRQFRETERAYGGREGYERDKAAGRTKLTYGQWVQVRTPAFLEWFGDWMNDPANASKVVDPETGEPMVVYHGTPNAMFVSFKDGAHFTEDADYAAVYMHPSASSINAEEKRADAAAIYPVYLAIQRPFDTRDPAIRAVFDREFFGKWGNATPLTDRGLPDWTDSRDLLEWIDETDQPFDGLILDEGGTPEGGHRGLSYVPVKSAQIKSATANNGDFSEDPNILKQADGNKKSPRGQIVGRDGQSIIGQKAENGSREFNITLFEGKDLSTVLHEAGHAFFEIFGDLAEDANASEQLKADYQTLLEASGAKTRAGVGREQHEWIARSFEAYTRDGKAPSASLRRAFAMFGTFLTRIYKVLSALNVNLTPEVRAVFDRMLASEEEIAEAQRAQSMEPLLREFDGWTPVQKAAYEAAVIEARGEAERRLAAEVLKAQQRAEKAWQSEERKKVKAQVEADTRALPVYRAIRWLRSGKMPDGEPVPRALKLSKQDLLDNYGPEILKHLRNMYAKDGGDSADAVAAALGFLSGRDLVDQIAKAPPLQDVVKADTDNIMAERYPDPMNDGSMAERAQKKVHSSKQRELMLLEINALERRTGRPPTQMQIMREAVKRILSGKVARKINPNAYRVAEAKAGREAFNAIAKGDHAAALDARRRQLLNSLLYSEASKIRAEVDSTGKLLKRYTKNRARAKVGKVGGTYLEQIDALLERFDFREVSGKASDRRMALRDWVEARIADGIPAGLPKRLLDEAYRIPYKDMTVDQLRELRDAVVQIAHLATLKGKLLLNGELRDRAEVDKAMAASVLENSKSVPDDPNPEKESAWEHLKGDARASLAAMTDIARRLDGFKNLGPVWRNTVEIIREAVNERLTPALKAAQEAVAGLYLGHFTTAELRQFKTRRRIEGVRGAWSKENILALAMNWGNEGNRAALLTQERGRLSPEEIGRLLATLDGRDWDFVEATWKAIDAYWPEIAASQRRRKGLEPEKVEASAFAVTLPDGTQRMIRGGYYPLKYASSLRVDAHTAEDLYESIRSGGFASASTRDGHTEARVGSAGQSVRLDLGVIDQHMRQVLYDLHMGDAVNYVARVLKGSAFRSAITDTGHKRYYHAMEEWLRDVATGELTLSTQAERIARALRQNYTAAVLGYKFKTAALQVTGIFMTAGVVGKMNLLRGLARYLSNPVGMTRYAISQSKFMEHRIGSTADSVVAVSSALDGRLKSTHDAMIRGAYVMIGRVQQMADVVSWLAGESAGLAEFGGDAKKARIHADDVVSRAQGSQEWADKAAIQRGTFGKNMRQSEVVRASVMLQSYNIAKHNALIERTFKAKRDITGLNAKSIAAGISLTVDMSLMLFADALVSALVGGSLPDDDDDDKLKMEWAAFIAEAAASGVIGAIPGVGSIITESKGYDTKGATTRLWADVVKASQQAWQGEADYALARALIGVGGDLTGIPSSQINTTLRTIEANENGEDVSPIDYLRGPPRH